MKIEIQHPIYIRKRCTCIYIENDTTISYRCIDCDTRHNLTCPSSTYSNKDSPFRAWRKDFIEGVDKVCDRCSYRRRYNLSKVDKDEILRMMVAHMREFCAREKEFIKAHIAAQQAKYNKE